MATSKGHGNGSATRPRVLLQGGGGCSGLWEDVLELAGIAYHDPTREDESKPLEGDWDVIIETETPRLEDFHDALHDAYAILSRASEPGAAPPGEALETGGGEGAADLPALGAGGIAFVPCYGICATDAAASYDDQAARVVGYTLFPWPSHVEAQGPIIEVSRPLQGGGEAMEAALEFLRGAGFRPELVGDAPGHVFGRAWACLVNEAVSALADGIASAADIDRAMRLGVNYPHGLFEWVDDMGLDTALEILNGLHDHFQEERYRPHPLLRRMALAERRFLDE